MTPLIVPDASVILKWGLRDGGERDGEKAAKILDSWLDGRVEIVLPRLWAFEVGNVLGLKNPSRAPELMEIFVEYRFAEVDTTPRLCRATFDLMTRFRVTFYDAVYHAVALLCGGVLVTADESYLRKARRKGSIAGLRDFHVPR